jgi:G3E family GTPase
MTTLPQAKLPVVVITGFLGSGKTTLLNGLLREWPASAVLINEFGTTPVDQQLIEQQGIPLMTLSGGCLCCQVRGALAPVLKNIRMAWGKPGAPKFERVCIETSGVASPEPVLDTLLRDSWLARHYRLDAIIAAVAAPSGESQLDRFAEAQAQVAWADRIIITQSDLARSDAINRLEDRLDALAPLTPRLQALHGRIDPAALQFAATGPRKVPEGVDGPDHGFRSVSIHLPQPLPWSILQRHLEALLAQYPELVRIKGVVHLPDQFEPVAIHGAGSRLFPPVPLAARSMDDARGRLVFITSGSAQTIADELMATLGRVAHPDKPLSH